MGRRGLRSATALLLVAGLVTVPAGPSRADAGPIVFRPKGITTDRFPVAHTPQSVVLKAHDGVDLFTWVYRPDTSSDRRWRTPVILVYSPYFGRTPPSGTYENRVIDFFTPKGYTVALSHVRGTGRSGGCLEQDGINQQLDFGTVVEWLARQPWSNGKVGSYGISYDGETQNAGAIHHPKGLVTIVPNEALSGLYDSVYFDGVPLYAGNQAVAASYAEGSLDPHANTHLAERPGCQPEQIIRNADPSGDMTPYFVEREFRRHVRDLRASVLYVEGFGDTNVLPDNIDGWYDRIPTFKRAIFGQWNHEFPDDDETGHGRKDWFAIVHAWYDHELLGLPTGVERWPAVQAQDQDNVWRAAPSFAGLSRKLVQPLGIGTLGAPGPAGSTMGFAELTSVGWIGPTLASELHLSGQVFLDPVITLDTSDAHFMVEVDEVTASGAIRLLTTGLLSARHRNSLTDPQPVPPGEPIRYHIRTFPFDATLAPGSHLRIVLSGLQLRSNELGFNQGLPALSPYLASVAVDGRSTVTLPVVGAVCGIDVRQMHPPTEPVPGCRR